MHQFTAAMKRRIAREETGATTAEYAVCTGAGVGFAGILFKFLASSTGQKLVETVYDKVMGILPF